MNIIKRIINWWNKYWEDLDRDFESMTPEQIHQFWEQVNKRDYL